jgi:uncharacterized double-CXXCG motif protein
MRVFRVRRDVEHWSTYHIDGAPRWCLGGITCIACGQTWAAIGLSYHDVDLSDLPGSERYFPRGGLSVEALEASKVALRSKVPAHFLLKPGTTLGPFCGTAKGTLADLVLPDWILFVRKGAFQALIAAGIQGLIGVPARLRFLEKTPPEEFLELQIEPHCILAPHVLPPIEQRPICSVCGHQKLTAPPHVALIGASIPKTTELFRGRDLTTYIFATERFVEAVQRLGLTGLVFKEVEITQN